MSKNKYNEKMIQQPQAPVVLRNGQVFVNGVFTYADVKIENGSIVAVGTVDTKDCDIITLADGMKIVPGFIDAHTHGAVNVDVNAATEEDLEKLALFFASEGTTSWLASVLTDTEDTTLKCIETIQNFSKTQTRGASLLGIHLEGPFLNPKYKGAMPEYLLREGDFELFLKYYKAAGSYLKYITIAPEVNHGLDLIEKIKQESNVSIAIGHTDATYDTTCEAIRCGVTSTTHTFNAMRLFHQHEPAAMGAVLESDIFCEVIADGLHLHYGSIRTLKKCKGTHRLIAVTDSIMATGLPDGNYKLGVNDIVVVDGDAKLLHGDARAGSTLTTGRALKNLVHKANIPLEEALPMLTETPATMLKLDKKGKIAVGFDADFVVLDENLDIQKTIIRGQV